MRANDHYTVCRECGARWMAPWPNGPRQCINRECDAQWLSIAQFANRKDADRAAAAYESERVASPR